MGLKAALFGLGKIGVQYALDPVMARHFSYISHIQVLADHPEIDLVAVVDPDESARDLVKEHWDVETSVSSLDGLPDVSAIDLVVLATPPDGRLEIIKKLPRLKAVMVEKPIASSQQESREFLEYCSGRNILVQANLWRRGDVLYREFSAERLSGEIGECQAAFGVYGNGLLNNAIHMVDFFDMMLGPLSEVRALGPGRERSENPIDGDLDMPFALTTTGGAVISVLPVDFGHYREVSFDFWGTKGRLEILVEGLVTRVSKAGGHRADQNAHEMASDKATLLESTVGTALWNLYDNLAKAVDGQETLFCPGELVLRAEQIVAAIKESAQSGQAQRIT